MKCVMGVKEDYGGNREQRGCFKEGLGLIQGEIAVIIAVGMGGS
jgi:hypothetical protein